MPRPIPRIFKKFGGRFVVRAGKYKCVEGHDPVAQRGDRISRLCHGARLLQSPEYQANIKVRQPHATVDMIIVEGYDGPQP